MMLPASRYRLAIDNVRFREKLLWALVFVLSGCVGYGVYALHQARQDLPPLFIPPDIRFGARLELGEVYPPNVYNFAGYVFQQLYRWREDGETDYGQNIYRLQAYLSPKYRAFLEADLNRRARQGELRGRERGVQEIPGHHYSAWRVAPVSPGLWDVTLDVELKESVEGMNVKTKFIRYPLRVIATDVDRQRNPWGLQLDGYGDAHPRELNANELAVNGATPPHPAPDPEENTS